MRSPLTIVGSPAVLAGLRNLLIAAVLASWPAAAALAQVPVTANGPNVLTMTELSSTKLHVSFSFLGYTEEGDLTAASPDRWTVGPFFGNHPSAGNLDNSLVVNRLVWLEPGSRLDDITHATFNAFRLASCNCNSTAPTITVASDLSFNDINNPDSEWFNYFCIFGSGFTGCPVLRDGESFVIPISYRNADEVSILADPMTVRFTDRGDVASSAPEPAAWTLMIGGFGLAGAGLRRRRRLAA